MCITCTSALSKYPVHNGAQPTSCCWWLQVGYHIVKLCSNVFKLGVWIQNHLRINRSLMLSNKVDYLHDVGSESLQIALVRFESQLIAATVTDQSCPPNNGLSEHVSLVCAVLLIWVYTLGITVCTLESQVYEKLRLQISYYYTPTRVAEAAWRTLTYTNASLYGDNEVSTELDAECEQAVCRTRWTVITVPLHLALGVVICVIVYLILGRRDGKKER